jgi:predicted permease
LKNSTTRHWLIATTLGTSIAFALALSAGRLVGRLSFREATLAGLSGSYGNIGWVPGWLWPCWAPKHIHPPVAIDNTLLFLQNAAAPTALFVLGETVSLRPFGRAPWEVPAVVAVKLLVHPLVVFGLMLLMGPFPQPWAAPPY